MAIDWESLTVEMISLAAIILGSVFFERWIYNKVKQKEEEKTKKKIMGFVLYDLKKQLDSIEKNQEDSTYFGPFFTDT